jgi:PAP2 superfamily
MCKLRGLINAVLCVSLSWAGSAYADAVTDWNAIAVQTIISAVPPRPIGFLDIATVHAAVYDAVQAIEGRFRPYHVKIRRASGSPAAAAAAAAYEVLVNRFPEQAVSLGTTYNDYLVQNNLIGDPGLTVGHQVAVGIIALRANDGTFPPNYPAFNGGTEPGDWRPTDSFIGSPPLPPPFSPMATPWLGAVTPFTLKSGRQFRAHPPPALKSKTYTREYNEAKALGARFDSDRTDEQTELAYFWASNYIVHLNMALRDIAGAHVDDIADSARLFALATLAMADAQITAWDSKLHYNYWRPLTAIREGDHDGNRRTVGDPNWEPLINTPNYPDYTSGANNVTGAATRALALFFGTDEMTFSVTTTNPLALQQTRTFDRFSDAAAEVVVARIYEGIHFRAADEVARRQGRRVAKWAFSHFFKPVCDDDDHDDDHRDHGDRDCHDHDR